MGGPSNATAASPALLAKGALRRLAQAQQEPTPENFARAYAEEAGQPVAALPDRTRIYLERLVARAVDDPAQRATLSKALIQGLTGGSWTDADRLWEQVVALPSPWAVLMERLARGLERGGRQWTAARKKDSLQRVLDGSRTDNARLQQRLGSLLQAWETDKPGADEAAAADSADPVAPGEASEPTPKSPATDAGAVAQAQRDWSEVAESLETTVRASLPDTEIRAAEIADALGATAARLQREGALPEIVQEIDALCVRARRWLSHRHHLFDALTSLCNELGEGLTELSEDDSWARGQCEALRAQLADGGSARGVRAAATLLAETRERQRQVRTERDAARDALKGFIQQLLNDVGELGAHTDRFEESVARHASAIEGASSIESLAGVVRELVDESRAVQSIVRQTRDRLNSEHEKAGELAGKVRELEGELRRLSDEVSTDVLTQVANRRGLSQAFDAECARLARDEGAELAIGLIDIDNFKRLNDSLGHAAGDQALKALASSVRERLRPIDTVARFGGEEFVVLLPGTPVSEGQATLGRLQRALSASLFMHEGKEVFVTFSAGVTQWRRGESIEAALERADEAMYEAKRTGKNRTCVA